jgi:hypothetical protein
MAASIALITTLTGCGPRIPTTPGVSPSGSPGPSAAPVSPVAEPVISRAGDLGFLLERLIDLHPDPFAGGSRASVEQRVTDLSARAPELSDDEFLVEVMRLVAGRARDGHTGLVPFAQTDVGLTAWPFALYWFAEGLYVVDARPPGQAAIGARVVEVAGRPVEDVTEAVTAHVSSDNEWTVRARLPSYLVVPQVLRGLGLLDEDEPALTLEGADGATFSVSADPIPIADFARWRGLFYPLVPPVLPADEDARGYLKNRHEHFWSSYLDDDVLYVGYNQVQARTSSGDTIGELAAQVEEAFEGGEATRVIVDIRGNPGGENGTYRPFLETLREQAADDPGSVVVLIGRSTFSAAGNFATELRDAPGVRLIGEPTGASPNLYGDADEVILPASRLRVHIATRAWEFAPGDDSLSVEPDVHVPVRWPDYEAGVDAALDVALEGGH